jgi:hypothetical protein
MLLPCIGTIREISIHGTGCGEVDKASSGGHNFD